MKSVVVEGIGSHIENPLRAHVSAAPFGFMSVAPSDWPLGRSEKHKAQPAKVALKVLRWSEAYEREKQVYARLRQAGAGSVLGFNVPQLLASDDELRVLEMTIVRPPFILDFAGAYLDARPQFPEEVWRDWEAEKREQFEERWPTVQALLDAFEALGIYLLDVSPGNITFGD